MEQEQQKQNVSWFPLRKTKVLLVLLTPRKQQHASFVVVNENLLITRYVQPRLAFVQLNSTQSEFIPGRKRCECSAVCRL